MKQIAVKNTVDNNHPHPGISTRFTVGGGAAGFIVAGGIVLIALLGIPMVKYFLLFAVAVGAGIAAVLHWVRR
jgi:hypothetical protein